MVLAKSFDEKQRWLEAFKEERRRVHSDMAHGFNIAAKDRLAAIQIAKTLTAGKEKRSKTKGASVHQGSPFLACQKIIQVLFLLLQMP